MSDFSTALKVLVDQYSYHNAFLLLQKHGPLNSDLLFLLEMMKERRELNIDFLFAHQEQVVILQEKYNIKLLHNPYDLELLANYIMDLEAKVKNGLIIDFVRSVSPILYRLFMILLAQEVPHLHDYIHNARDDHYDTWKFKELKESNHPVLLAFSERWHDSRLTSKSLAECLQLTDLDEEVKSTIIQLRQFEKSVRNPLAHLIKPFYKQELYRTTQFSSQAFLDQIIFLAKVIGVEYDTVNFHYDTVNKLIIKILE
ncbi:TPA: LytR family transcriptional regulator [Streptococcus agalactiae]